MEDNAPPARHQELEIDRHMDINYDLFLDLTADYEGTPSKEARQIGMEEYEKDTKDQLSSWRAFYGPRTKPFTKRNLPVKSLFVGNFRDTPRII